MRQNGHVRPHCILRARHHRHRHRVRVRVSTVARALAAQQETRAARKTKFRCSVRRLQRNLGRTEGISGDRGCRHPRGHPRPHCLPLQSRHSGVPRLRTVPALGVRRTRRGPAEVHVVLLSDRAPQLRPQSRRVRVAFTQVPKGVPRHVRSAEER